MPRRGLLLALFLVVVAWIGFQWTRSTDPGLDEGVRPDTSSAGFRSARIFFANPNGDGLVSESRELLETQNFHDRVAALVEELDRGPQGGGRRTLPAGTAVLHAYLDDRGQLTLDLSAPFRDGFRGGAGAEYLAVATLIRTLSANLPEVRQVMLVCAGLPLTTLAGHLPLDRPIDVASLP